MVHPHRNHLLAVAICAFMVLASMTASANVIYVKWDSPGTGSPAVYDGKSWATAFHTVGAAITAAAVGDEVWVAVGTYKGSIHLKDGVAVYGGFAGTETARSQRDFRNRRTYLVGTSGWAVVDCSPWPDAMTFRARLDGFTIMSDTGCTNTAVDIGSSGRAVIANNAISTTKTSSSLGAIYCYSSDALIVGNTFTTSGCCGVYCYKSSPVVMNNVFAQYSGGGVYCELAAPTIANNTMWRTRGAGVYCVSSSPLVSNNIISGNVWGVYVDNRQYPGIASSPVLNHNCIYGNSPNYYQVQPGASDLQVDPKLAWASTHIQTTSPCVDAGDDSVLAFYCTDMDGEARLQGAHVDIGADETAGAVSSIPSGITTVTPEGDDAADGASWQTARRTVQGAVNSAAPGSEIWVSTGVYPERITLKEGIHVYGGFSGFETARDKRDLSRCPSILDGNKLGPVVMSPQGLTSDTQLDGFTIRNGAGTKDSQGYSFGGGIYCDRSSPTIANNIITGNSANAGAGIYCISSQPVIQGNTVSRNDGNGIYCSLSSAHIIGNTVRGNIGSSLYSQYGGGIVCTGSPSAVIANNVVVGNSAGYYGGGVYCTGGTIANNTIVSNSAMSGGAIYCSSAVNISNNVIAFNSSGILVMNSTQGPTLRRNCLYANGVFNYMGWTVKEDEDRQNLYCDPRLASVSLGNLHIRPDSPCIDMGDRSVVDPAWTDIDGQVRSMGMRVDIGADESDGTAWNDTPIVVRVKTDGNDDNDGATWALAKKTVQAGIESVFARGAGEVWVKAGTYNERISLRAYVHVYGGFNGTESERLQADPKANATVLDGRQLGCVVTSKEPGFRVSTIDGFTITNGKGSSQVWMDAGGVYCYKSSPIISRNIISNNTGASSGGGIEAALASPDIVQNSIMGNNGCGIDCTQGSPLIRLNYIANNTSDGFYDMIGYPSITGNVFAGNSGCGLMAVNAYPSVRNNTLVGNNGSPGAIRCSSYNSSSLVDVTNNVVAFNYAGISVVSGTTLRNNCVFGNTRYNTGAEPQNNGIAADPLFVNRTAGDYHLLPGSPCIDRGYAADAPAVDIDGTPRPLDGDGNGTALQDVGAYEAADTGYAKRSLQDGATIGLTTTSVTATPMPGASIYVENASRSAGIRVATDLTFSEGQVINVFGTLQTDEVTGERYIVPGTGWPKATGSSLALKPLTLTHRDIGGGTAGLQAGVWDRRKAKEANGQTSLRWADAVGTNSIGLLVTVFGSVTYAGDGFLYVDDGSALDDGSGHVGLKVQASGLTFPSQGLVKLTGISSCEKNSESKIVRVLRVRTQDDIVSL